MIAVLALTEQASSGQLPDDIRVLREELQHLSSAHENIAGGRVRGQTAERTLDTRATGFVG